MKFLTQDYDKLIEILYRNPFITYKDIVKHFNGYTTTDISLLFKDIRAEYVNDESIDAFLANNSTPQDTILFINGALRSLYKDSIDQSKQLGILFEEIGEFYLEEEKNVGGVVDPCYSVLYKYMSALMLDKKLPILSATESALVLALMYEILNFSNEMFKRKPEFTTGFCENIQNKLGQILLKSVLSDEEWNENNEKALIDAFNIPVVDKTELAKDPVGINKKIQKQIALMSINPFNISPSEVEVFKEVIDELIKEDNDEGRDVNTIFKTLGINPTNTELIVRANNGEQVIVHKRKLTTNIVGGTSKRSEEEANIERNICERSSQNDIIDVDKFKKTLPVRKKRKLPRDL